MFVITETAVLVMLYRELLCLVSAALHCAYRIFQAFRVAGQLNLQKMHLPKFSDILQKMEVFGVLIFE